MVTFPQNNAEQTLVYKHVGKNENHLLFYPPTKELYEKAPLLFLIPGGGWQRNLAVNMYNMAKATAETLRSNGFAVAAVDYRGQRADNVSMREIVCDIYDALGYVARFSNILQVDAHRVYTMGHSAGAHLSLMAAYDDTNGQNGANRIYNDVFTVKGVAAISPATIMPFENRALYTPIDIKPLFAQEARDEYDRFSPYYMVNPNTPPTYLAAGDKDYLILPIHSDILYKALTHAGVKCKFTLCKGGDHCCLPAIDQTASIPDLSAVLEQAAQFILECEEQ